MDEEALNDAYTLFNQSGYKGDIKAFQKLISTNETALKDAHALFASSGYKGDLDKFSTLVGVGSKKKVSTGLPFTLEGGTHDLETPKDGGLVSQETTKVKKAPEGIKRTADVQLEDSPKDSPSTVLMADFGGYVPKDANGKHPAFPTLFPKDPENQTNNPKDWIRAKNDDEAYEIAKERGEVLYFDTYSEAKNVSQGAWKEVKKDKDIPYPNLIDPKGFGVIPEQIVDGPVADLYDQYKEAGVITPVQQRGIDTEFKRQQKGDRSWWETLNALADGMLATGLMIPLYQFDSREELLEARGVKNRIDFLEALPEEKVKELNSFAVRSTGELSKESRNVFAENAIIQEKSKSLVNNIRHVEDAITRAKQEGKEISIEGIKHYRELIQELKGMEISYNQNVDILESDNEQIGSFVEELDFLKKNYGGLEYYQDLMRLSGADIVAGISEFGSSTMKMSAKVNPLNVGPAKVWEEFNKEFREEIGGQREFLKPVMSVTDIESPKYFGKWLAEQTATQLPVIAVLAAGGSPVGLTALGTSSAGQKIGELRDEGGYSETEMYLSGIGFGAMEVLSERVSLGILSKGKRTLKSIGTPALKTRFKAGVKDFVVESTKDAISEGGAEFVNQMSQNLIDIMYLGKEDVHVLDGTLDALASGTAMGFGMSATPAIIGMGAKAFTTKESGDQIVESIKTANELLTEVAIKDEILAESTKKLMKSKAKKLIKSVNKTINKAYDDISNLEQGDIQKLINIDKQANKILTGAKSIQESELDPATKKDLIADLQVKAKSLREKKNKLLEDAKKTKKVRPEGEPKEAKEPSVGDLPKDDGSKAAPKKGVKVEPKPTPFPKKVAPKKEAPTEPLPKTVEEFKKIDISESIGLNKVDNYLKDIENQLKDFGKETLGVNIPLVVAQGAVKAMRGAVATAKTTADIVSAAINHMKTTDWYKGLSKKDQAQSETDLVEQILKVGTKVEQEKVDDKEFKRKPGKKSLLSRMATGGNNKVITDAIEKHGLEYEVENQEIAQNNAIKFVKNVGIENALAAVRNDRIKGAEKAFVYSEILDQIATELEGAKDLEDAQQLESFYGDLMGEIANEYDIESREAGRFISALNKVYNSSKIKYSLSRQVEAYKANNGGAISDEVLQKFKEAEKRIKNLEGQIKDLEAQRVEDERQRAVDNIKESVDREKGRKTGKKSPLTKKEHVRKKVLKGKFLGVLNDITRIATLVADPEFREYIKLVLKQAKGDFNNFSNTIIKELGKGARKHLPDLFKKAGGKGKVSLEDLSTLNITEDGKISIPSQLIRDYVEQGITDIDQISNLILDSLKAEHPNLTLREVRDAITGYGKQINLSKEDIAVTIRKMKRLGKLLSMEEDVAKGKRPKRSGLQRDKISQEERSRLREIRDIMRDLPMDEADLTRQWKTALDAVKSRLRNQIEDLEKQIEKGEKIKPERAPIAYDVEAKELKKIRDDLKSDLEDIVGKTELTDEQKIGRTIKSLERSIEKLQEDITDKRIEFKEKPKEITSQKIKELREIQKSLRETIGDMRKDAGIVEARRISQRKKVVQKRIDFLKQRLKDKDFSRRKIVPLKVDEQLIKLNAEKSRQQEIFDKEQYKSELRNRSKLVKFKDALIGLWGIPRIILATAEWSFVFIQGGIQTVNLAVRKPRYLFKTFKEAFVAMSSESKAKKYKHMLESQDFYQTMKNSKLALTQTDYKLEAREETFQADMISTIWDLVGKGLGSVARKKEFTPLGNKILTLLGLSKTKAKKATLEEQFKNVNPFRAIERANTQYMNNLRVARFLDGMKMLEMKGKNEIDHKEDYVRLAKAINSLTGRASIGRLENVSDILNTIFFSFKNTVSTFNQLNPYFYAHVLRDSESPMKVSVAQKIALTDMFRFVGITTGFMLLMQAAGGKDEEGEWRFKIEMDPRSSDFMKIRMGNIRFDPWHGMTSLVALYARIFTAKTKRTNEAGTIVELGKGYRAETRQDILVRYVSNKFSPSTSIAWRFMGSHIDEKKDRVDQYGNIINLDEQLLDLKPIYFDGIKEVIEEDPDAYAIFLLSLGVFGLNSQVYGQRKK